MKNFPKITQKTEQLFLNLYDIQNTSQKFVVKDADTETIQEFEKHKLIEKIHEDGHYTFTTFGLDFAKVLINKNLRSNVLKKMTLEDYLLAIYYLIESKDSENEGSNIIPMTDIARYLGLSNSSISEYIRIIEKEGYITVIPRKGVLLTMVGEEKVIRLLAKRTTLTEFFNRILKIDFDIADVESHVLEHNVSPMVIERINLLISQLNKVNFSLEIKED